MNKLLLISLLTLGCSSSFTSGLPSSNRSSVQPFRNNNGDYSYIIQCRVAASICMKEADKVCPVGFKVLYSNEYTDSTGYYGWMVVSYDSRKCQPIKGVYNDY